MQTYTEEQKAISEAVNASNRHFPMCFTSQFEFDEWNRLHYISQEKLPNKWCGDCTDEYKKRMQSEKRCHEVIAVLKQDRSAEQRKKDVQTIYDELKAGPKEVTYLAKVIKRSKDHTRNLLHTLPVKMTMIGKKTDKGICRGSIVLWELI